MNLIVNDMLAIDEYIFFIVQLDNSLYKLNLKTKVVSLLGVFDGEEDWANYIRLVQFKNKIFIVPRSGKSLWNYDLTNNKFTEIKIQYGLSEENKTENENKFFGALVYQNNLLLLPGFYPCAIKINIDTGKQTRIMLDKLHMAGTAVYFEGMAYVTTIFECGIIKIDLEKNLCTKHMLGAKNVWYGFILLVKNKLFCGYLDGTYDVYDVK